MRPPRPSSPPNLPAPPQPGVLNRITSVLGEAGINIASFGLGRHQIGGEALGVLSVDVPVPAAVLAKLRELPQVRNVRVASIPAMDVAPRVKGSGAAGSGAAGAGAGGLLARGESGAKPLSRPSSASFGSGPTKKRPGWSLAALSDAALGRSHRSKLGKDKLKRAIDMTRALLALPKDYLCGIVPASDTGAYEMAMWTLLGPRPVEVRALRVGKFALRVARTCAPPSAHRPSPLATSFPQSVHFESFGAGWHTDLTKQLKLAEVREHTAAYGALPDLSRVDTVERDVCFTWNGTTSGVRVPNADWISAERKGLTLNDATSAVFSQPVDFAKCDATTFSWQKVLGGEGAHGMLILSPRARERLESHAPKWPLPKVFRLAKKGKLEDGLFRGETINTPSMLCVEDYLDALTWADKSGGVAGLTARADANLAVIEAFVAEHSWIRFLAADKASRSNTSVCLTLDLAPEKVKALTALLEKEGVAFDIGSYRDAPPGLRIWAGATVEAEDMAVLMEWVGWAYKQVS